MNGREKKQLAQDIEDRIGALLAGMTAVLRDNGFEGLEVVGFTVGDEPEEAGGPSVLMAMADGTPCPVRCVPLPDGSVRCLPQC